MSKIEELLPHLLKQLSNSIAVSATDVANKHGIAASSVRNHLKSLHDNFYQGYYKYDGSSKKWVVIEGGFLQKMLLKPEEVVILNSLIRGKSRLGKKLIPWHEKMVHNYVKRTSSFIFKQDISEDINENMEQTFAQIHTAIDEKKKLSFQFSGALRVVFPYKIINIEYYWYLLGYEESCSNEDSKTQCIKFYTISRIRQIAILDDVFSYNFDYIDEKLEHTMNAYCQLENDYIDIELYIEKDFCHYVDRASFFSAWHNTKIIEEINYITYTLYNVKVTDKEYREITPTILKYLPNIVVKSPEDLRHKINEMLRQYQNIL